MKQNFDRKIDEISSVIDNLGFEYCYTEHNMYENSCDVYRSVNCRFLLYRAKNKDEHGINFYILDAKRTSALYDSCLPSHGNIVFQGFVDTIGDLDKVLHLFKIDKKTTIS